MHNIIILGSGRSGTSMVMGLLGNAGYFMGDDIYPPNPGNPKGIFEDRQINRINEDLLTPCVPRPPHILKRWLYRDQPYRGMQKWLARISPDVEICATGSMLERIVAIVEHTPFCFKDPRFSYTLPIWRPFFENARYICVFRHPADTALSMQKECARAKYLRKLNFKYEHGLEVWKLMYGRILERHAQKGEWLFIHFDQVLTSEGQDRIEAFTGVTVNRDFPEARLQRSVATKTVTGELQELYERLCKRADYDCR